MSFLKYIGILYLAIGSLQAQQVLWRLPFINGTRTTCTQGVNGSFSHNTRATYYDLDLANPENTTVVAAADGTAYPHTGATNFGNHVTIDHGNGLFTLYGHLARSRVTWGQHVQRGEKVGQVGNTGFASGGSGGYHVHFGIHSGNVFSPNQSLSYSDHWTPPTLGTETVKVGVFNANRETLSGKGNGAMVTAGAGPATIDVWRSADGSQVSGLVPFKALRSGRALGEDSLFWSGDDG